MEYLKQQKIFLISAILILFGVIYTYTMFPGIGGRVNYGDSAKWQFLWAIGGTPHSTGYPFFLILSKMFGELLFFLDYPYRISSISMVSALGTLLFLYLVSCELIPHKLGQLIPVLIFGSSVTFWSQATEAEVYTLNSFFVSLVVFFFIRYQKTENRSYFIGGVLVYAVSFGNHLTMITLLPAILYATLTTNPKTLVNTKTVLIVICFIFIGASQYFYLLYLSHHGGINLEYIGKNASVGRWLSYITGGQFAYHIGRIGFGGIIHKSLPNFIMEAKSNISLVGLFLGVFSFFSVIYTKRTVFGDVFRIRRSFLFLFLTLFFSLSYNLTYSIPDISVYYIPSYFILSVFIGYVVCVFDRRIYRGIIISIVFFIILLNFVTNLEQLKTVLNPLQDEAFFIFESLPEGATLYIPREGDYKYHGLEAINYHKYIEFPQKKIHYTVKRPKGEFYFLSTQLSEVRGMNKYTCNLQKGGEGLFDLLAKDIGDTLILSVKGDATRGLSGETLRKLVGLGLKFDELAYRGSFAAILSGGKVVCQGVNNAGDVKISSDDAKRKGVDRIYSAGLNHGDKSEIVINGKEYSLNKRGINWAVIKEDGHVIPHNIDAFVTDKALGLFKASLIPGSHED